MNSIDSHNVEFACPNCNRKVSQTIAKMKANAQLTCRACGQGFTVDAHKLRARINDVEKSLADLQRRIGRLGK